MKLQVLVDNNVMSHKEGLRGEHGLSMFIEADNKKILFDTGATDLFLENAKVMQVDLKKIDIVALSHHHYDHTGGLKYLHGDFKVVEGPGEPVWLTERLVFLGTIDRVFTFDFDNEYGDLLDDSALAYISSDGLVIITGCSHSGICNIVEYAKKITNESRVVDILGGLHLVEPSQDRLNETIKYLQGLSLNKLHPGHCSDFQSKIAMAKKLPVKDYGVGLSIEHL